jgi:hypothetical protein
MPAMDRSNFVWMLVLLIAGCAMGVKTARIDAMPALGDDEPFAVIAVGDTIDVSGMKFIGTIKNHDRGLTIRCGYDEVIDSLSRLARTYGANILKVEEHLPPTAFSTTCHRVRAGMYRVDDARPYEKRFYWSAGRELMISDFKGSRTDRPGIANSFVGLHHELRILPLNVAEVKVRTYFDPDLSYFKRSEHDDFMLLHERLMFDLVELYARELRRRLQQDGLSRTNAQNDLLEMRDRILHDMVIERDRAVVEIGNDAVLLAKWCAEVQARILGLDACRDPYVRVALR